MIDCDAEKQMKELENKGHVYFTEKAMTINREQMLMVVSESIDYVVGDNVIELGYTDRGWTDALLKRGGKLTVIEGSKIQVDYAQKKYGEKLDIRHQLFRRLYS